jgi:hypothetical protein
MKLDAGIYEFMKAFREDRLAKMDSGDIPVSLAAARGNETTSGRSSGSFSKPRADGCALSPAPALADRRRSC